MKALLLHPDHDFDLKAEWPVQWQDVAQDLELETILNAMAAGDAFVLDVARKVLAAACGPGDAAAVRHRQAVMLDALHNAQQLRALYALVVEAIESRKKHYFSLGLFGHYPGSLLHGAVDLMGTFTDMLRKLRTMGDAIAAGFESPGMRALFASLQHEINDDYFAAVKNHLDTLKLRHGALISAQLGTGHIGTAYTLRLPNARQGGWLAQLFSKAPPAYSFRIADRDEAGGRALTELHDRGIADVARVMAQSADHVLSFFEMLRLELAFYIGCLNLHERLQTLGVATCMPIAQVADCTDPLKPVELAEHAHQSWHGLRDPSLALTLQSATVANDGNAGARQLIVITGANQGGKSTLLRALGQAQLMLHAGMFVAAEAYIAPLRSGVFTHYKREEDATMQSGKFDEELIRMSAIANTIRPGAVLLFNEPFASTNEREGSEIMLQVIDALRERGIAVWLVTHLVSGARTLYQRGSSDALFLRAERRDDGVRSFRLVEGEPLQTSFGADLYTEVFGQDAG